MIRRFPNYEQLRLHLRRASKGLVWAAPGQVDAGLASLATFLAGIFAVRLLTPSALGAYALLFSAFQIANQVSSELIFVPSQIIAVDLPSAQRLSMWRHSVPRGGLLAVIASMGVPLGALPIVAAVDRSDLVALAVSAIALATLSPIQDHLRALFHLSQKSWVAALMSAVNLLATGSSLFLINGGVPSWKPFGALAVGNAASLVAGVSAIALARPGHVPRPALSELFALGKWLIATGISKNGLTYLARTVLNFSAGTAALGFVEGARIVAQPINVVSLGLMAQAGPRLIQAGSQRDLKKARAWRVRFWLLLTGTAIPYLIIAGFPTGINPLTELTPRAFEVRGLTAAVFVAVVIGALVRPLRTELLGARLQRDVTRITILSGAAEIAAMLGGRLVGPFAAPIGLFMSALFAVALYSRKLRSVYRT